MRIARQFLAPVVKAIPGARAAARIINVHISPQRGTYSYYRELFIANGRSSPYNSKLRQNVVKRFENIDRRVTTATTPVDGLVIAEALFNMTASGEILECGCYAGASTAKLSILADILQKKLIVFDSFEGLPEGGEQVIHMRRKTLPGNSWTAGKLGVGLAEVRRNIEDFGEISVCSFVPGWFKESLIPENFPDRVAAAFTDVDLESSTRDCLLAIWPRLSDRGVYFTHDVAYVPALKSLLDENVWIDQLKCCPPILFGAGFGVCDLSPHLGYMVKGSNITAEYLKSLTLNK